MLARRRDRPTGRPRAMLFEEFLAAEHKAGRLDDLS